MAGAAYIRGKLPQTAIIQRDHWTRHQLLTTRLRVIGFVWEGMFSMFGSSLGCSLSTGCEINDPASQTPARSSTVQQLRLAHVRAKRPLESSRKCLLRRSKDTPNCESCNLMCEGRHQGQLQANDYCSSVRSFRSGKMARWQDGKGEEGSFCNPERPKTKVFSHV